MENEMMTKEEMLEVLMSYKEKVDADVKRLMESEVRKERREFFRKVSQVQAQMKVAKSQYNNFGKYNFRSLDDILITAKPILNDAGLVLLLSDNVCMNGDWHYIEATATLTDGINEVSVKAYSREVQDRKNFDQSQITGACSSYARKMAASGVLGVSGGKDMDELNKGRDNGRVEARTAPAQNVPSAPVDNMAIKRKEILRDVMKQSDELGVSTKTLAEIVKKQYKKKTSAELTLEEAEDLHAKLRVYAAQYDAETSEETAE